MRALLIGAVEGTRVALDAIAAAPDWELAALGTLPPTLAGRHSDFVDLAPHAAEQGAALLHVANCNSDEFIAQVQEVAPDIIFVIGWSQLCGTALRRIVNGRVMGYHTAALPRLRGRATIPWTILLEEKITASTLFWIDDGVDSGPILAQRFFHVAPDETAATLYAKHMRALRQALDETLPRLAADYLPGERQDERLATWAARRRPDDGKINWNRPAREVDRLIRAVGRPYPGAFTWAGSDLLTVWEAEPWLEGGRYHGLPGQVLERGDTGFSVACGDGQGLRITRFESSSSKLPALHGILGS